MALVSLRDVTFGYSRLPLLDEVSLEIEAGERLGLVGRNGAGKSTLMRLVHQQLRPDHGQVLRGAGVTTAWLMQEVPAELSGTIGEQVTAGIAELEAQNSRDATPPWKLQNQVDQVLSRMKLDPELEFGSLSAGMKRRVLLARAIAGEPDILLLDEPTNHLDIDAIAWLEEFLSDYSGTLMFVTHDRMFLRRLATRIIELDRGKLRSWACDYETYLQRKEAALEAEAAQQALFDKRLAQEEVWIRQGIKARRTRNEGRVKALKKLRVERSERRERVGNVRMEVQEAQRTGRLVVEAKEVAFSYGQKPIIQDLTATIFRGDRVGIVGPNGAGKTTLMRLLLGQLQPQEGTVRLGTRLEIAYFDQLHAQLDETQSVQDNVAEGNDHLSINGQRRHVLGYLSDFLFAPDRARSLIKHLSGGERNRLLLAKMFAKPANVLVLDEPTNDLDAETLDLLEELLLDFSGTVLLVSHDREFLDHVVTTTLALEGNGVVKEYAGGYEQWLAQRKTAAASVASPARQAASSPAPAAPASPPPAARKLSYKEQRELDALPQQIESLETEQRDLHAQMASPGFYQQDKSRISELTARLAALETQLSTAYARWEELGF